MNSEKVRRSLADRSPLPPGAGAVGVNLALASLTTYGFLAVTARTLGPERFAPISVLWSAVFLIVPTCWGPLEAEVGRRLAARSSRELGGRPVARSGAVVACVLGVPVVVTVWSTSGWTADAVFDGQRGVVVVLGCAVGSFAVNHLWRAAMAGNGSFRAYGACVSIDSASRLAAVAVLAAAGVESVVAYAVAVAVSPLVPVLLLRRRGVAVLAGPPESSGDLGRHVVPLIGGQAFAQVLVNGGPIVVAALATQDEQARTSQFLAALVVARIPLFFFQAVQGSLLPALATMEARNDRVGFVRQVRRLLVAVVGTAAVGVVATAALGPAVVRLAFGDEFALGRGDLATLAAGAGWFMVATVLAHALVAMSGHRRVAVGWAVGVAVAGVVVVLGQDLVWRVESGFAAGCTIAAIVHAAHLVRSIARWRESTGGTNMTVS